MKVSILLFSIIICIEICSGSINEAHGGNNNQTASIVPLDRRKRFICGGFCIAMVVTGVVSLTGMGLGIANKEMDGALYR